MQIKAYIMLYWSDDNNNTLAMLQEGHYIPAIIIMSYDIFRWILLFCRIVFATVT